MLSVKRTHHSYNSSVGKSVMDTFILSRHCQNVFNVNLKYLSLGGFSVSAVFTPDLYAVSRARECKLFPEGEIFICSLRTHTGLGYERPARGSPLMGKEHQSCYFEKDTLQKKRSTVGFCNRSCTGGRINPAQLCVGPAFTKAP